MALALMFAASLSSLLGDWRAVMWLTAAVSFGALIMWTALARERPVAAADPLTPAVSAREGLRRVLRVRDVWLIALIQLCVLGAAMAAVGLQWLPWACYLRHWKIGG